MATTGLTEPNPELAKLIKSTPNGMAHWAGTGPEDKTCATCRHHGQVYARVATRPYGNRCKLFQQRMNGKVGGNVPASTAACKYFEPL